jgi:peptidyl-prolyl cis-trans isomerase SurA
MSDVGKLLEDKLYAHQAIQDSVKVTDAEEGNDGGTIELHGHQIGSWTK